MEHKRKCGEKSGVPEGHFPPDFLFCFVPISFPNPGNGKRRSNSGEKYAGRARHHTPICYLMDGLALSLGNGKDHCLQPWKSHCHSVYWARWTNSLIQFCTVV